MKFRRVVVTGLGALTPIGNSVSAYWNGLVNGVSGAALIKSFDTALFKTKFACEVKNFDADGFLGRKDARKLDPFVQYALYATDEAVKDAGIDFSKLDTSRIGVIWGSGIGGLKTFLDEVVAFAKGDGTPRFNPFFIPKMIADIAPGHISIKYGLRGPNFTTVSACASSNNSLIDSFNYIRLGKANMFITGGSEAIINEAGIGGFNAMHALSVRNDDPATASRPFDLDRDGFVAGEGAGTIILEELEHAKARGAKIYAEMIGGGMSADAYHMTAPHPEGLGAALVMKAALEDAGLQPSDVDYVNVHGTSTPIGDPQEVKAIQDVFGENIYNVNISSTKSMTGHLLGAAGAVEAIASILALNHNMIPPTINHFTDDPAFDPKINFTFNKAQAREVNVVQSNGFGFGGHNASVIFRKYEEQ
jgi:3-oxoacyl-[acyl-carrier-protein] synthase II